MESLVKAWVVKVGIGMGLGVESLRLVGWIV